MSDAEINAAISRIVHPEPLFTIVKRGLYYRPNGNGYTAILSEAWKLPLSEAEKHIYPRGEQPVTMLAVPVESYTTDLNAMHEAEELLTKEQRKAYASALHPRHCFNHLESDFEVAHSGPRQRAEAFLRTLNLWKEASHE